jgi:endonuclease-3
LLRERCTGDYILNRLRNTYTIRPEDYVSLYVFSKTNDVFKTLVATILSQNSTDKAALRAYTKLETEVGITVERIQKADEDLIKRALRTCGLYNNKSRYLKELSDEIRRLGGSEWLKRILELEEKEAKSELLKLHGVGEKTADVILLLVKGAKVFPVDTHISRIARRMGLVDERAGYKRTSEALLRLFKGENNTIAHLLLIAHGRNTCRPRKPNCGRCVLRECCNTWLKLKGTKI